MFSSNQKLELSGDLALRNQLEDALLFALKFSDHDKNMDPAEIARGCKLVYQISKDKKYCIGWGFEKVPEGWTEYPFDFAIDIVAKIIRQHLEKCTYKDMNSYIGGSTEKGFLMKQINVNTQGIKNPFYGIVSFEPYTCFYAK